MRYHRVPWHLKDGKLTAQRSRRVPSGIRAPAKGVARAMPAAVCGLTLLLLVTSAPVSALTPHPKYVNSVHREAPSTKSISNKKLAVLGGFICDTLVVGATISDEFGALEQPSNSFHFNHNEIVAAVSAAVYDICPRYKKTLAVYLANSPVVNAQSTPPATTAPATQPTAFFDCTGSAPGGVDITYGTDTSNPSGGTSLPFRAHLAVTPDVRYFFVSAQLQGSDGRIACTTTVVVNGTKVSQTGTTTGENDIASAEVCSDFSGGWQGC
jgi:hypothetical protein